MSSDEIVIDVQNITKHYEIFATPRDRLKQFVLPKIYNLGARSGLYSGANSPRYYREFSALNNVSFQVRQGETLGIIGRNGSGKSTLLQIIAGTLTPTSGNIQVRGRIAALLELGSGFDPEFSGRDNVFLNGRILGLTQKEIESRYDQIVEFADIGEFINQPVKTYSSGMFVRLAFAVQAHIDASIVIIDEALAVGDIFFRQKCYARLEELRSSGAAILLVSHSMPDIEQYCERAVLLDRGIARFIGSSSEAAKHYYLMHQGPEKKASSRPTDPVKIDCPIINSSFAPPPKEAFIDISRVNQVTTKQAACTGVALCNGLGEPCNVFKQGDIAVFYHEYEIYEDIGVPVCGVVIKNDRGVIVHGKNSLQFDINVSSTPDARCKVYCRHEIKLDLEAREYTFELGLSAVSVSDWENRSSIPYEEISIRARTICVVPHASTFSIGLAIRTDHGTSYLTHHGVANLPGKMIIAVSGS